MSTGKLNRLRSWGGNRDGSVAIEFAMLVLPFTMILIGIMEISLMFAAMTVLDGATNDAARKIRTGQVQQASGNPETLFKNALCAKASVLLDCAKIVYEVIEMDKFADFNNYAPTYDANGKLLPRGFSPGGVNTVNLIRVSYLYPLATPLIGNFLSNGPGMTRRFLSTVVLETEPYDLAEVASQL